MGGSCRRPGRVQGCRCQRPVLGVEVGVGAEIDGRSWPRMSAATVGWTPLAGQQRGTGVVQHVGRHPRRQAGCAAEDRPPAGVLAEQRGHQALGIDLVNTRPCLVGSPRRRAPTIPGRRPRLRRGRKHLGPDEGLGAERPQHRNALGPREGGVIGPSGRGSETAAQPPTMAGVTSLQHRRQLLRLDIAGQADSATALGPTVPPARSGPGSSRSVRGRTRPGGAGRRPGRRSSGRGRPRRSRRP
jgi:hypothetical protein